MSDSELNPETGSNGDSNDAAPEQPPQAGFDEAPVAPAEGFDQQPVTPPASGPGRMQACGCFLAFVLVLGGACFGVYYLIVTGLTSPKVKAFREKLAQEEARNKAKQAAAARAKAEEAKRRAERRTPYKTRYTPRTTRPGTYTPTTPTIPIVLTAYSKMQKAGTLHLKFQYAFPNRDRITITHIGEYWYSQGKWRIAVTKVVTARRIDVPMPASGTVIYDGKNIQIKGVYDNGEPFEETLELKGKITWDKPLPYVSPKKQVYDLYNSRAKLTKISNYSYKDANGVRYELSHAGDLVTVSRPVRTPSGPGNVVVTYYAQEYNVPVDAKLFVIEGK